jgi:hypothetical protein
VTLLEQQPYARVDHLKWMVVFWFNENAVEPGGEEAICPSATLMILATFLTITLHSDCIHCLQISQCDCRSQTDLQARLRGLLGGQCSAPTIKDWWGANNDCRIEATAEAAGIYINITCMFFKKELTA